MFDEYFKLPSVVSTTIFTATLPPPDTARASSSTSIDQDALSSSTSPTTETTTTPIQSTNVEQPNDEDKDAEFDSDTFTNPFAPPVTSSANSSLRIVDTSNMHTFQQPQSHIRRWTKDHPLVTTIGNQSKPVSTRRQLAIDKYGLEQCDALETPMVERSKLNVDLKGTQVDPTHYLSMVFRCLKGTINMGTWYPKDTGFDLTNFENADNVGCQDSRKSTSGSAQFMGEKLLTDYGFDYNKIPLYCDSKSAIALSCNTVQYSKTKHIAVRYHFIKEQVENEIVELYFVKMDYQLADIFTKALAREHFEFLINRLGMQSIMLEELKHLEWLDEE
ncbi:hypothetical protein Tco_1300533 [Tanacetum coccineum]